MAFLGGFWDFLMARKAYWISPILLALVLFGGLILLTQGSTVAPFVYTLF